MTIFSYQLIKVLINMLMRVYHLQINWENFLHTEFSGEITLFSHIPWSFRHFIRNLINLKIQFPEGDYLTQV